MVLSFFRRGESGMEHIVGRIVTMLGDARHSFDVATGAVLHGVAVDAAAADIRATDARINRTEHELRRELIVHVSVHGTADIGQVLGHTLLIKKVERIGDQAKNILDLALEGVSLAGAPDLDELSSDQQAISALFGEVSALLLEPDADAVERIRADAARLEARHAAEIVRLVHSDEPGYVAVPRAVLHRYLKRIVANLVGVALTVADPLPWPGAADDG